MRLDLFFFFFSSRRRHTRSLCDWSSDVCSSDLLARPARRDLRVLEAAHGLLAPVYLVPRRHVSGEARRSGARPPHLPRPDRKSTRLNSSHTVISYAVFCLKKKTKSSARTQNNDY